MPPNLEPPRYSRRDLASSWYHALYGQVPGSEQDPMFEPEVDDDLDARHLSNLAQIMTALAPAHEGGIGLTFANLSKGLHDHHPGSGGLALVASFRALRRSGSVDHAGREGPLIKHALISANRALDRNTLHLAALSLLAHTVGIQNAQNTLLVNRSEGPVDAWYREYRQLGALPGGLADRKQCILKYVKDFDTLPDLSSVHSSYRYTSRQPPHRLLYIEYPDSTTYYHLAGYSAQLAAALYMAQMTDMPWAVIEIGTRGYDIYDGIAIRFVPRGYLRPNDPGHRVDLDEMPPLGSRDGREQLNRFLTEKFNAVFEVVSLSVPSCPLPGSSGDGLQTPRLPPLSGGDSTVMVAGGAATVLGEGPSTFREHRGPAPHTIVQLSDGGGKSSDEQTRYHFLPPRESGGPVAHGEVTIEPARGPAEGSHLRLASLWESGSTQPVLYGLYGLGALTTVCGLALLGIGLWGRQPAPALKDFQPLVEKIDESRTLLQSVRGEVKALREHSERPCPPRGAAAEPAQRSDRAPTAPPSPDSAVVAVPREKGVAARRGTAPKGGAASGNSSPYKANTDVHIEDDSSGNGQKQ